jgi:hypothetical protein
MVSSAAIGSPPPMSVNRDTSGIEVSSAGSPLIASKRVPEGRP